MITIAHPNIETQYALDTSNVAGLGTITGIVAAGEKAKYRRYKELAHAKNLLVESNTLNTIGGRHRTRACSDARAYQAETISLRLSEDPSHSHASLAGVAMCGSPWSCPVCSTRIAVQRGKEIRHALKWASENGYQVIMLTFTASHHAGMTLDGFKAQFKAAYRALTQSREWRRVKKLLQVKHGIKAVEPTFGSNGWHYHCHVLMFIKVDTLKKLSDHELANWRNDARKAWLHELSKVGLSGIGKFALDFSFHGGVGEKYLSKLGISLDDVTDVGHELSGSGNKDGSGATVWTMLRRSQFKGEKAKAWGKRYVEYVKAMQGENWITWSHGLKALVGVEDMTDDNAAKEEENDNAAAAMIDWLDITDEQYRAVRKLRAYAELLELAAATRSKSTVLAYLSRLAGLCDDMDVMRRAGSQSYIDELRQQYQWAKDGLLDCRIRYAKKPTRFDKEWLSEFAKQMKETELKIYNMGGKL